MNKAKNTYSKSNNATQKKIKKHAESWHELFKEKKKKKKEEDDLLSPFGFAYPITPLGGTYFSGFGGLERGLNNYSPGGFGTYSNLLSAGKPSSNETGNPHSDYSIANARPSADYGIERMLGKDNERAVPAYGALSCLSINYSAPDGTMYNLNVAAPDGKMETSAYNALSAVYALICTEDGGEYQGGIAKGGSDSYSGQSGGDGGK